MYNRQKIKEAFKNLIGFAQTDDADYPSIDPTLLPSTSGTNYQDYHPLLTPQNLDAIKALGTTPFSQFLEDLRDTAIFKLLNALIIRKKLNSRVKELVMDTKLFEGNGSINNRIVKRGRLVGFELSMKGKKDISIALTQLGTQFDTINGATDFYIFHSSQAEPVQVITVDLTKQVSFEWNALENVALAYSSEDVNAGGSYYFCYYEEDLTGQAVGLESDLSRPPCGTCSKYNIQAYRLWSQYIQIHPFSVSNFEKGQMFDLADMEYNYKSNWGLNLNIKAVCDITEVLIRNKNIFVEALGTQFAVNALLKMSFNMRTNADAEKLRQLALYELDNRDHTTGLKSTLDKLIEAIDLDLSGMNSDCLPCQPKAGIKYKSI